jgi:hypothetical protein
MFRSALLALPLLVGCATMPPIETATLPRDAVVGAGDPTRTAVLTTNSVFGERSPAAGRPAAAARAIAQMEFLAVDLPQNNSFTGASSTLAPQLITARREWRGALDIAPEAPPQAVINALYAASRALENGQTEAAAAALPSSIFRRGGAATLTQLAALPRLPNTAAATGTAQPAMTAVTGGRLAL